MIAKLAAPDKAAEKDPTTLEDLDRMLGEHCRSLADDPTRISATTRFSW